MTLWVRSHVAGFDRVSPQKDILSAAGDLDEADATIMKARLALDLAYFSTSSLRGRVVIIARTIRSLFSRGT